MRKKLLFMYLKTGGGHLSPAKALAEVIDKEYGETFQPVLIDGLAGAIKPAHWLIEDGYRVSINYAKWIFEALYFFNKFDLIAQMSLNLFAPVAQKLIADEIVKNKPTGIVIFHYFLIQPVFEAMKQLNISIPVKVIVTDPFTAHPIWFLDKRPDFLVFSHSLRNQLINNGFAPGQVTFFPQIISRKFEDLPDNHQKRRIIESLNLDPFNKTVLIFGGGDGMKKGLSVFKRLLKTDNAINIIMICGRNSLMEQMAQKVANESGRCGTKVFGFVENVHELLAISDVVVSKCGASALAEIMITAKVPVIVDYIWEQEKGNVDYILDNNLGFYEPNPDEAVAKISELIDDEKRYNYFYQNIKNQKYRNGVSDIAGFLTEDFHNENSLKEMISSR